MYYCYRIVKVIFCALIYLSTSQANIMEQRQATSGNGLPTIQLAIQLNPCSSGALSNSEKWTNGIIPYAMSDKLPESMSIAVQYAIQKIESTTCVHYLPYTLQQDYIFIEYGRRCCSHRGRVGYGLHYMYVHESCNNDDDQLVNVLANAALVNWELLHSAIECEASCGESFYIDHPSRGMLTSPGYPSNYLPNMECMWKLWIANGTIVQLNIREFEIENEINCFYDYLEIIEQSIDGKVMSNGKYCGTMPIEQFNFTAGSVSIHFKSDTDIQARGFQIEYNTFTAETNVSILCSEYNGGCSHICVADENGAKVECSCEEGYAIGEDTRTCEDINECLVKRGGCDQRCKNTLGSYFCHCKPGFGLAADNQTCLQCGEELNSTNGIITSPGFPSSYLPHQNCLWTIHRLPDHYIRIVISNFDITVSSKCMNDYLKPQHGNFIYKRRICGNFTLIKYIVQEGSSTYFQFRSYLPTSSAHMGFNMTYEQVRTDEISKQELETVYVDNSTFPYQRNRWLS